MMLGAYGEAQLLDEEQLLEFYQNAHLDCVDDFVEEFINVCLS